MFSDREDPFDLNVSREVPSSGLEPETSPLPREIIIWYKLVIAIVYREIYIKFHLISAKISAKLVHNKVN